MAERVRKLSPEEVAAQGLVDLLHVEKAKLGVTDKDLRAWRPAPATTAPPRTGPTLAIVGSCEGCAHLRHRSERGVSYGWTCGALADKSIGYSLAASPPTPAWCPELAPARLALARAMVAEAEPSALAVGLVPPDEAAIHRRMGSTPIVDADALFGQELRVYPSEEQKR